MIHYSSSNFMCYSTHESCTIKKPKDSNLTIRFFFNCAIPLAAFVLKARVSVRPADRAANSHHLWLPGTPHTSQSCNTDMAPISKCLYLRLLWNIFCVVQDKQKSSSTRQVTVSNVDSNDTTKRSSKEVQ